MSVTNPHGIINENLLFYVNEGKDLSMQCNNYITVWSTIYMTYSGTDRVLNPRREYQVDFYIQLLQS